LESNSRLIVSVSLRPESLQEEHRQVVGICFVSRGDFALVDNGMIESLESTPIDFILCFVAGNLARLLKSLD